MHEMQRQSAGWRAWAACAGLDTEIFYPEPSTPENKADAKAVCARCEVRLECLVDALTTNEGFGIRGGFTARERRTMARRLRNEQRHNEPAAASMPTRRPLLVAVDCG
jgi:WhiB family redox-sensing transcriptional regulator